MKQHKPIEVVVVKKRLLYLVVITLLTAMLNPLGYYAYTNYIDRKNRADWCELITFYSDYYRDNPPTNPLQQKQRELMDRRSKSLNCK